MLLLERLLASLNRCDDAEQAAQTLLGQLAEHIDAALQAAEEPGRTLRALLHRRVGGAYTGLVHLAREPGEPLCAEDLMASQTAWDAVERTGGPWWADLAGPGAAEPGGPALQATRRRLRRRQATHLLAWPLRAPGRGLLGMVSAELLCPDAAGSGALQGVDALLAAGQALVDLAGAWLALLPPAPAPRSGGAWGLPVLGRAMRPVVELLEVMAPSPLPLLLEGPSGVGKTSLAREIHRRSGRSGPLQVAALGGLPEDVVMSTLFGHRRGAFTGADHDEPGLIHAAAGGTLLLDDVHTVSLKVQAALLRLVDERVYSRLGESTARPAEVRILAACSVPSPTWPRRASSARTCATAWSGWRCGCPRWTSVRTSWTAGPRSCWRTSPWSTAAPEEQGSCAPRPCRCCATPGRATCASCTAR